MRRKEQEIVSNESLLEVIDDCKVIRIATMDQNGLYIVPLNFGYEFANDKLTLYLHSAKEGRKVDAFREHPQIAFEMDTQHRLKRATIACHYSYQFKSIVGNGVVHLVENIDDKKRGCSLFMKHQTGEDFIFSDDRVSSVHLYRVDVTSFTGKENA